MLLSDSIYTQNMTDHQRAWFYAEYERARKDEVVGVLFAIFLGCFGVHHFYLRRNGLGVLYLLLCWTGISAILGLIDAFFTPGRVRRYNATQAIYIASQIKGSAPYAALTRDAYRCNACSAPIGHGAIFCPHCGAAANGNNVRVQPAL
jgi:TM2 domain-containing membrane protein YozV